MIIIIIIIIRGRLLGASSVGQLAEAVPPSSHRRHFFHLPHLVNFPLNQINPRLPRFRKLASFQSNPYKIDHACPPLAPPPPPLLFFFFFYLVSVGWPPLSDPIYPPSYALSPTGTPPLPTRLARLGRRPPPWDHLGPSWSPRLRSVTAGTCLRMSPT